MHPKGISKLNNYQLELQANKVLISEPNSTCTCTWPRGEGRGGVGIGGNLVWVCDPEFQNIDLFKYCSLIFYTHLLLVVDRYCSQFTEYQENKQPKKFYEQKNIHIYRDVRNVGPFTYKSRKKWVSHILFVEKRKLIIYLAALKKGPFGTHIHTMP